MEVLEKPKNIHPCQESKPRFLIPPALSPVIILKNCTEQCPSSEADSFSDSKKNSAILWNQKVHYLIHNSPPPVTTLSRINPFHVPIQLILEPFLTSAFNLRLGFASCLFPSGLTTKTPYAPHLSPIHATCPAHLLDLITRITSGEQYRS